MTQTMKTVAHRGRVIGRATPGMAAIQAWLDQLQAHWDVQLRSFKRHVEERHVGERRVEGRHAEGSRP